MASKNFLMINGGDWGKEVKETLWYLATSGPAAPKETSQLQMESSDKQKLILSLFNNMI